MFCVGDIVVYGAQGLCKVDGIGPLPMKFADKSKRYYTLHTCKQPSMTIYAPVDNQTVVMRQPLNRAQAETLIAEMPQYAVVPIMDAKERESRCREALQTCDCREIAKMIKGLHDRHEIRVQHKKHDTAADERYFRRRRNGCTVSLLMPLAWRKMPFPIILPSASPLLNVWQSYRAGNINAYHLFLAHSLFLRYNINKILPR